MDVPRGLALVLAAYGSGSVPWGVVLGKVLLRTDLRRHGSGGTGATNAMRVLGWRISVLVFVLDFLKGFGPVLLARGLNLDGWWVAAVATATVFGHCWSPWIGFRGGKGMATGAGAAAGLLPWVLMIFPVMLAVVLVTRYVSLASIVGSVTVCGVLVVLGLFDQVAWSVIAAIGMMTAIIVLQHRGNIARLVRGTERRFGEPAT